MREENKTLFAHVYLNLDAAGCCELAILILAATTLYP
jgi:hypothetical protein